MAISCLIYGIPSIGKTALAMSAPKPFCIDIDHGAFRVPRKNRSDSATADSYPAVLELLNSEKIKEYKTIIIDTYGQLVEMMGEYLAQSNPRFKTVSGFSQQCWGAIKGLSRQLVNDLKRRNQNIIFIAHSREDNVNETYRIRPDISGASGKELTQHLGLMGYMYMKNNGRCISFTPTDEFYAKSSEGITGVYNIPDNMEMPNDFFERILMKNRTRFLEEETDLEPLYTAVLSRIETNLANVSSFNDLQAAYDFVESSDRVWDSYYKGIRGLEDKAEDLLKTINSAEDANNCYQVLKSIPAIWEDKSCDLKNRLNKRTKDLNLSFNKDKGEFVC